MTGGIMMFLLQEAVTNTNGYMIAGYAVIFSAMLLYVISLIMRYHKLRRDLETLEKANRQ